ncbi:MAG: putative DNA-binding domain-containing protein [Methylophilus sp.]|nr:putative DNA-binding domain-containing protein [Methylophilus sp.]
MTDVLPDFQQYQMAFTAHIRNPALHGKPANVPEKRMAVYRDAIFNNFLTTVSACFPVCQQVLGARGWKTLVRRFVAEYAAKTPIFKDIPFEFVQFLGRLEDIPVYLTELAHYEWVELEVTHQLTQTQPCSAVPDFLNEVPQFSAHQLLAYAYPVHQISKKNIPREKTTTYLLVYRNATFSVKFMALNPVTYHLLSLLKAQPLSGRQALKLLATELGQSDPTAILQFGHEILLDLARQEVFMGTSKMV